MYQPSVLRRVWWKYLSLHLPWRRKLLAGYDLEGNLFFTLGKYQSSGRQRRMVKYRQRKDWASYSLTPQWQAWLRHSREDAPSVDELLADQERIERTRQLAKIVDEGWLTQGKQPVERLGIGIGEEALKASQGDSQSATEATSKRAKQDKSPADMKRDLPAQDPGTTFQPNAWSSKITQRS